MFQDNFSAHIKLDGLTNVCVENFKSNLLLISSLMMPASFAASRHTTAASLLAEPLTDMTTMYPLPSSMR